jgi:hypothetical protein
MRPTDIASGSALVVPDATLYHFGVLSSAIHNSWLRCVGGRMKSDPQYSNNIVYNNFPWPEEPTAAKRIAVERAAQGVLDARAAHPESTLADLYDPLAMPPQLTAAHAALDRAVERCYRPAAFRTDRERVEHLLALYDGLMAPALPIAPPPRALRVVRRRRVT